MRWLNLILFCVVFATVCCEPEPKKYKSEVKIKEKEQKPSLTETERNFLREVEAKFGIKNEDVEVQNIDDIDKANGTVLPFPAVIAIEIVNDTDSKTKGKRTIDANLGYGYRTNNGYSYTYFGKPTQEKGKFMIYPYSQEDIPLSNTHRNIYEHSEKHSSSATSVDIQPSQAYELVEEQNNHGYNYQKPTDDVKGLVTPPAYSSPPSTLYTTYNGQHLSGLSGQFPMVMPNYFVDPNQLIKNPHYQSVGLTHDHLRPHGSHLEQKVVPVLVLRVPSSYIKNPSAELYANLPKNYPLSQHLNNINLQELVNQYFKKIGYSFAPQIKTYPTLPYSTPEADVSPQVASRYEPQHYANPYVKPSYTQSGQSGVQYSAVKPVMAKYPSYPTQYVSSPVQQYQEPQQQYEYKYVSRPDPRPQAYYTQQYYQQNSQVPSQGHPVVDPEVPQHVSNVEYTVPHYSSSEAPTEAYEAPQTHYVSHSQPQYETKAQAVEYEQPKEEYASQEYGAPQTSAPVSSQESQLQYGTPKAADNQQYYYPSHNVPKETVAIYSNGQTVQHSQVNSDTGSSQSYVYQKQVNDESEGDSLILTENYPSKDHTIATVLPTKYQSPRKQAHSSIQSVSYVTPIPHKYQSPYNVMVPQTVLKSPSTESVQYVNSHSLSSYSNQEYNPEHEYTVSPHYVPPVGKQKPPSYPRNYHSHPKRMTKTENKPELKTHSERSQKKKSS